MGITEQATRLTLQRQGPSSRVPCRLSPSAESARCRAGSKSSEMPSPGAIFALLAIYCFKDVDFLAGTHGAPELLAAAAVVGLHLWKHSMLISVAGGTILYRVIVQCVFV